MKRIVVWLVIFALLSPLALLQAKPVYASEAGTGSIQVVDFDVSKSKITKDTKSFNITLTVLDTRITSGKPTPTATLQKGSFSVDNMRQAQAPGDDAADANGYVYKVKFNNVTYNGKSNHNFVCVITYEDASPAVGLDYLSFNINQCVTYVAPKTPPPGGSSDGPEIDNIKGTDFVLKDARYGSGEPIYAGQAFTLSAEILATNGTYAVENVSVSFSPPEQLTFADGSSVVYIGTMSPGASSSVSVKLMPSANLQEGSYTIGIDVRGVNAETGVLVPGSMTITVPILQPERFEIFNTYLPTDLMANMDMGMGYGSVTLVNQGRGAVGNVTLEIVGDGLFTEDGRTYIGNVGGGEQRSADFNLMAGIPGMIEAKVIVTYENVRGEIRTLEHEFYVNVMDGGGDFFDPGWDKPGFDDPGWGMEDNTGKGVSRWLWIIIVIAAAAVVTIILVRRHRKKKKAAEEELDYDMDDEDV